MKLKKKKTIPKKKLRILVVEDDKSVRHYITETLRENGFIVCEAENGVLALEKIRDKGDAIDCVLSDIVMPAMDGERLAKIVRDKYPKKKIILMSGYTASESLLNKIKEKDYVFIRKPFIIDDLIDLISS